MGSPSISGNMTSEASGCLWAGRLGSRQLGPHTHGPLRAGGHSTEGRATFLVFNIGNFLHWHRLVKRQELWTDGLQAAGTAPECPPGSTQTLG